MICEEKDIQGTLYRYHPDEDSPMFTASWLVTLDGEIKAFMCIKPDRDFALAFGSWVNGYPGKLKLTTATKSVKRVMKQFGFVEMNRCR